MSLNPNSPYIDWLKFVVVDGIRDGRLYPLLKASSLNPIKVGGMFLNWRTEKKVI